MILILLHLVHSLPQVPYHNVKIFGNFTLGYYYAELFMGTPPQVQSLITDTGSGITTIPCSACFNCGRKHLNAFFDPNKSSTSKFLNCKQFACTCQNIYKQNSCGFHINYVEGSSLSGIIIEDYLNFNLVQSQDQKILSHFGCTYQEKQLFYTQLANGIMGLSPIRQSNILEQTYSKHNNNNNLEKFGFSLCYGYDGGIMTIGGINQSINLGNPIQIPYKQNHNVYTLNLTQLRLQNYSISDNFNSGFGVFLDSGTTYTYFKRKSFQQVQQRIDRRCHFLQHQCKILQQNNDRCYLLINQSLIQTFPIITFEFENSQKIDWKPENYFYLKGWNKVCLGIKPFDRFMLGTTFFRHLNIFFDLTNKLVVIQSSNCGQNITQGWENARLDKQYEMEQQSIANGKQIQYTERLQSNIIWMIVIGVILTTIFLVCVISYCKKKKKQYQKEKDIINVDDIGNKNSWQEIAQ